MKIPKLTIALFSAVIFAFPAKNSLATPRTPLPPFPQRTLYSWRFDDTGWLTNSASAPLAVQNVNVIECWSGYALQLSGPTALLSLPVAAAGRTNFNVNKGAVLFWFAPAWSGTNAGGPGPGGPVRLFELGAWSADARTGWAALYFNPEGTAISLGMQANGQSAELLQAPVQWSAGEWHQIALVYSAAACTLYLDGVLAAQGAGITAWPSATVLSASGFCLGSDSSGGNVAQGQFDELSTFAPPSLPTAAGIGFNYSYSKPMADLGPVTDAEVQQKRMDRMARLQTRQSGLMRVGGQQLNSNQSYGEEELWLELASVDNQQQFVLHNTVPGLNYEVLTSTNLTDGSWQLAQSTLGADGQDYTELPLGTNGGSSLFLRAQVGQPIVHFSGQTGGETFQSMLQLAGYAEESLKSVSYQVSGGQGVTSSGAGFVTSQFYDPVLHRNTTNWFRLYDVALQPGTNTVALTFISRAGLTNIVALQYVQQTTGDGDPPFVTYQWPADGAQVAGDTITVHGSLDDPGASVQVTVVNDETSSEYWAMMERTGQYWLENLPLGAGTNYVTTRAIDPAGNVTSNTVIMIKSAVQITIDPEQTEFTKLNDDLPGSVVGAISSTNYAVWVNGKHAQITGFAGSNATWIATNVVCGKQSVGLLEVVAIPLTSNGGEGTPGSGGEFGFNNTGNPSDVGALLNNYEWDKPTRIYLVDYHGDYTYVLGSLNSNAPPVETQTIDFVNRVGGTGVLQGGRGSNCVITWSIDPLTGVAGPLQGSSECQGVGGATITLNSATAYFADVNTNAPENSWCCSGNTLSGHESSHVQVRVGGKGIAGESVLLRVHADTMAYSLPYEDELCLNNEFFVYPDAAIPAYSGYTRYSVGALSTNAFTIFDQAPDANYDVYALAPAGAVLDTKTTTTSALAKVNDTVTDSRIKIMRNGTDITGTKSVVWVGQQINLLCELASSSSGVTSNFAWEIPATVVSGFIRNLTNGYALDLTNTCNSNVVFYWVSGHSQAVVKCSAVLNGQQLTALCLFDVRRPDVSWNLTPRGYVNVTTNYCDDENPVHAYRIITGIKCSTNDVGMYYEFHVNNFRGYTGPYLFYFIQIAHLDNKENLDLGYPTNWSRCLDMEGLDDESTNPAHFYYAGWDTPFGNTDDTPWEELGPPAIYYWRRASFKCYLLFEPVDATSIPVPLKLAGWSFYARACIAGSTTNVVVPYVGVTPYENPQSAVGTNCLVHPTWTNNVGNRVSFQHLNNYPYSPL